MRYSFTAYILVTIFTWLTDFLICKYYSERKPIPNYIKQILFSLLPSFFTSTFFSIYILVNYCPTPLVYIIFQYWLALYFTIYFSKSFYLLFIYSIVFFIWTKKNIFKRENTKSKRPSKNTISRRSFVNKTALFVASIPFVSIGYGILKARFEFQKIYLELKFKKLPANFKHLKIVQISDIHLGTFYGFEDKIKYLVEEINKEKPDLLIFTGDLVNNFAEEVDRFIPILTKLKASLGKIAILGNHDYGDYSPWDTPEAKIKEQKKLQNTIKALGFRLLLNELIAIHIDNQEIGICGVENWGHYPFPKYGNIEKASMEMGKFNFNILLTHDPDHWEAEILNKKDFALTLSGHTHGFQAGLEWKNLKWSPASFKFKRWGGLYQEKEQFLYVNRGIGSLGLPVRIGMPPEITIITLI